MKDWFYFTEAELACKCCGVVDMDSDFMKRLVAMRGHCGFPFQVSSAYRCVHHNKAVGGVDGSAHTHGKGIDLRARGKKALEIIKAAQAYGFTGIGVSQKGKDRFIHLDDKPGEVRLWSY